MRIEIILFVLAAAAVWYVYTDGKYVKLLLQKRTEYMKYLQMGGIVLGTLFLYWLIKKNPNDPSKMIQTTHEYIKYLPIDGNTKSMLSPILDFTAKHTYAGDGISAQQPVLQMPAGTQQYAERRVLASGSGAVAASSGKTKRSVSETKKKFVASRQNWKCGDCGQQLNAWFEVDHKIRLEHGGSNHVDNLVAMCRECHGHKTTIENL
jgi:5-methylcytosine-specific restriction endonuclease McrA